MAIDMDKLSAISRSLF